MSTGKHKCWLSRNRNTLVNTFVQLTKFNRVLLFVLLSFSSLPRINTMRQVVCYTICSPIQAQPTAITTPMRSFQNELSFTFDWCQKSVFTSFLSSFRAWKMCHKQDFTVCVCVSFVMRPHAYMSVSWWIVLVLPLNLAVYSNIHICSGIIRFGYFCFSLHFSCRCRQYRRRWLSLSLFFICVLPFISYVLSFPTSERTRTHYKYDAAKM